MKNNSIVHEIITYLTLGVLGFFLGGLFGSLFFSGFFPSAWVGCAAFLGIYIVCCSDTGIVDFDLD